MRRAVAEGDRDSWNWVIEHLTPFLERQARNQLGSLRAIVDARDLVHDAWLVVLSRSRCLVPRHRDWVRVVMSFLIHTLRNKVKVVRRRHFYEALRVHEAGVDDLGAGTSPVVSSVSAAEIQALLWRTLSALPTSDREIVLLRGIQEVSNRRAARRLRVPESTAAMRYVRARRKLRRALPASVQETLTT